MMKIYLARHGQDKDNESGVLNGHRDTALTDLGLSQAKEIAEKIYNSGIHFDKVYSSPLQRAYQTAQTITERLKLNSPEKLDLLVERDFGVMSGKLVKDIEKLCAPDIVKTDTITYFLSPEGSETFPDLIKRAEKFLQYIQNNNEDKSILLVTHGDFGKMIYAYYYQLDWQQVLSDFHFGNGELLLLAEDSPAEDSHVFNIKQYNL